jgi:hypothetical protein
MHDDPIWREPFPHPKLSAADAADLAAKLADMAADLTASGDAYRGLALTIAGYCIDCYALGPSVPPRQA